MSQTQQNKYKRTSRDDAFSGANIILKAAATGDLVRSGAVLDKNDPKRIKGYSNNTVIRRNTLDSIKNGSEDIITIENGVAQYKHADAKDKKATIFPLNITGRISDIIGLLAHKFKLDDTNYGKIQSKVVWSYVVAKMIENPELSLTKESVLTGRTTNSTRIAVPGDFASFYDFSLKRTKILEDESRSSDEKKADLNDLLAKLEWQADYLAFRLLSVTGLLSQIADQYIRGRFYQFYHHDYQTSQIRDWVNSDNNIYDYANTHIVEYTSVFAYFELDQLKAMSLTTSTGENVMGLILGSTPRHEELAKYLNEKYEDVDLSLAGKLDFLKVYDLAQRHGLINNLYVDFVPSLRSEKDETVTVAVDYINAAGIPDKMLKPMTVKVVSYPRFQNNGTDLINSTNAYTLGYAHKICFDEHLKGDKKTGDGSTKRTKSLTTDQAVDEFCKGIAAKMTEYEKPTVGNSGNVNPVYNNLRNMGIQNPTVFTALMMREKVYVASDTWNPKNASGLTVKPKTGNTAFLYPHVSAFSVTGPNDINRDTAFKFICRCFSYSASTRRVQSTTKKVVDNRSPAEKFQELIDVFYPNGAVPRELSLTSNGASSPAMAVDSFYSSFTNTAPQMPSMPQLVQPYPTQQVYQQSYSGGI